MNARMSTMLVGATSVATRENQRTATHNVAPIDPL